MRLTAETTEADTRPDTTAIAGVVLAVASLVGCGGGGGGSGTGRAGDTPQI